MSYATPPETAIISSTVDALTANGITVHRAATGSEAKAKLLEIIPEQAEVMTMTSATVDSIGAAEILNDQAKYRAVRPQLMALNPENDGLAMLKLGAAPEWAVGSVHAITQQGEVVVASATGSQLPAYAYGASKLVWVVGSQKITKDLTDAMRRINEYVLPLESERARKAYGVAGSSVNKVLIFHREVTPNRLHIILVDEALGF
jgi:hypothetical protein